MSDQDRLDRARVSPKKSLGQNFLHDPNALEKIVAVAEVEPDDTVLEIGPGTGNLTRVLARHAGRVIAVELDDRLLPLLEREFGDHPRVEIVHGDILATNVSRLIGESDYLVVANLPYYITSAIIRYLLENKHRPRRLVLTMQREVAERLVATPGDLSLLAVSVQFYGQVKIALRLNPGAFWPRPDVESAVVRIDVYDTPPVSVPSERLFFQIVRAGFGQKRKQLRNAISTGLHLDKAEAERLLIQAGIDPQRRAEALNLDEWAALTRAAAETDLGKRFS